MTSENNAVNNIIPTACLLTGSVVLIKNTFLRKYFIYVKIFCLYLIGVNLPDHESLFNFLASNLKKSQPPVAVAILFSEHFTNIKNTVINMVSQLINPNDNESDVS